MSNYASPEQIIFVGGAPRSGTSLTQALICTSPDVCDYHSEISFYQGLIATHDFGLHNWSTHTEGYFPDRAAYLDMIRELSTTMLNRIAANLGGKRVLCVKDPMLTPRFPDLARLHGQNVKFVTVARHPDDVVRSRQEVFERTHGPGSFDEENVRAVATEYVQYYALALTGQYDGRHFSFCYENIADPVLQMRLAAFCGVPYFDDSQLWTGLRPHAADEATHSPKYGQAIDTSSRLGGLPPAWSALTAEICAPIMEQYGYRPR